MFFISQGDLESLTSSNERQRKIQSDWRKHSRPRSCKEKGRKSHLQMSPPNTQIFCVKTNQAQAKRSDVLFSKQTENILFALLLTSKIWMQEVTQHHAVTDKELCMARISRAFTRWAEKAPCSATGMLRCPLQWPRQRAPLPIVSQVLKTSYELLLSQGYSAEEKNNNKTCWLSWGQMW